MIYTCIKYPLPWLVYILCLQWFSCIFESTFVMLICNNKTICILFSKCWLSYGQGVPTPPPWKITKNIGFLSNTGPDPLKKKAKKTPQSYQASIQLWAIIDVPAKCRLNGVLLVGRWWLAYSSICLDGLSPLNKKKKKKSWTPSDKSFWIWACHLMKQKYIGLNRRNPVLGVSDQIILKPVCSATETI